MVKVQQEKRGGERRAPRVAKKNMKSHKFSGNENSHAPNKISRSLINHFNIAAYTAARQMKTFLMIDKKNHEHVGNELYSRFYAKPLKKF